MKPSSLASGCPFHKFSASDAASSQLVGEPLVGPVVVADNRLFASYLSGGMQLPQIRAGSNIFVLAELLTRAGPERSLFLHSFLNATQIRVLDRAMTTKHIECGITLDKPISEKLLHDQWERAKDTVRGVLKVVQGQPSELVARLASQASLAKEIVLGNRDLCKGFILAYSSTEIRERNSHKLQNLIAVHGWSSDLMKDPKQLRGQIKSALAQEIQQAVSKEAGKPLELGWLLADLLPGYQKP